MKTQTETIEKGLLDFGEAIFAPVELVLFELALETEKAPNGDFTETAVNVIRNCLGDGINTPWEARVRLEEAIAAEEVPEAWFESWTREDIERAIPRAAKGAPFADIQDLIESYNESDFLESWRRLFYLMENDPAPIQEFFEVIYHDCFEPLSAGFVEDEDVLAMVIGRHLFEPSGAVAVIPRVIAARKMLRPWTSWDNAAGAVGADTLGAIAYRLKAKGVEVKLPPLSETVELWSKRFA